MSELVRRRRAARSPDGDLRTKDIDPPPSRTGPRRGPRVALGGRRRSAGNPAVIFTARLSHCGPNPTLASRSDRSSRRIAVVAGRDRERRKWAGNRAFPGETCRRSLRPERTSVEALPGHHEALPGHHGDDSKLSSELAAMPGKTETRVLFGTHALRGLGGAMPRLSRGTHFRRNPIVPNVGLGPEIRHGIGYPRTPTLAPPGRSLRTAE